jgi:murein DD-endopeptidase MepM/ murein hydrolase activator NlpD
LVILVHPAGFITAYGHNQKLLVVPGQRVERGQVIAELGSTGRSKGPHVHFEFLYGGKNCDPAPLFRPDLRRKNGDRVPIPRAVWKQANKRPKVIKCFPRKHHPDREPKLEQDDADEDDAIPDPALSQNTPAPSP